MSKPSMPDHPSGPRLGLGRSAEVFALGSQYVLKLYKIPFDPAAVEGEFAASRHAHRLGLPVPKPVEVVERGERSGIVFERLHGPVMHDAYLRHPLRYVLGLRRLARLQREIHVREAPRPLGRLEDTLRLQIQQAPVPEPTRQAALEALHRLPRGDSFCHGDLHADNVVVTAAGLQIIDWQKAGIGAPAADVARSAMLLRYGSAKLGWYGRVLPIGPIRALLARLYVGWYCQASGVRPAEVRAWLLPVLVGRLFGKPADAEPEIRAASARLAKAAGRRDTRRPRGTFQDVWGMMCFLTGFAV